MSPRGGRKARSSRQSAGLWWRWHFYPDSPESHCSEDFPALLVCGIRPGDPWGKTRPHSSSGMNATDQSKKFCLHQPVPVTGLGKSQISSFSLPF